MMATFTSLPTEIRLQILRYLVIDGSNELPYFINSTGGLIKTSSTISTITAHNGQSAQIRNRHITWKYNRPAIMIRNIDAMNFQRCTTLAWPKHRTCYNVRVHSRTSGHATVSTTYEGVNREDIRLLNAMMYVDRQSYRDATAMLYSTFILDFDKHLEAFTPFLQDITSFARCNITSVCIVKSPPVSDAEHTRQHWAKTMSLLSDENHGLSNLKTLHIGFNTIGKHTSQTMIKPAPYTVADFEKFYSDGTMPWCNQLLQIRNLQHMHVFQQCEEEGNLAMTPEMRLEHYKFSVSVENSLATFLRDKMGLEP